MIDVIPNRSSCALQVFMSEVALPKIRGALTSLYQFAVVIGEPEESILGRCSSWSCQRSLDQHCWTAAAASAALPLADAAPSPPDATVRRPHRWHPRHPLCPADQLRDGQDRWPSQLAHPAGHLW